MWPFFIVTFQWAAFAGLLLDLVLDEPQLGAAGACLRVVVAQLQLELPLPGRVRLDARTQGAPSSTGRRQGLRVSRSLWRSQDGRGPERCETLAPGQLLHPASLTLLSSPKPIHPILNSIRQAKPCALRPSFRSGAHLGRRQVRERFLRPLQPGLLLHLLRPQVPRRHLQVLHPLQHILDSVGLRTVIRASVPERAARLRVANPTGSGHSVLSPGEGGRCWAAPASAPIESLMRTSMRSRRGARVQEPQERGRNAPCRRSPRGRRPAPCPAAPACPPGHASRRAPAWPRPPAHCGRRGTVCCQVTGGPITQSVKLNREPIKIPVNRHFAQHWRGTCPSSRGTPFRSGAPQGAPSQRGGELKGVP